MEKFTKRKAEKFSQDKDKKHVRFGPVSLSFDHIETPVTEEIEPANKDVHSDENGFILEHIVDAVSCKRSDLEPLLTEEEQNVVTLAYEYKRNDILTNGLADELVDEYSDDEYEPRHYHRRESSTDSVSSLYSTDSTTDGRIAPPYLPFYSTYGVSIRNPYEGLDFSSLVLPPFSNHMRKTTPSDQNIGPSYLKLESKLPVQRESDMMTLINQPFIIAARKLSDAVTSKTRCPENLLQ